MSATLSDVSSELSTSPWVLSLVAPEAYFRMPITKISVRGARQHNLKNISVEIPRNSLTVITGLSGSGKSSLAFDTIYAEGQRRYVETLSAYARQFLDQLERPDVDAIDGLSPAISIEQKTTSRSPRSTVGTITEIYDYLRLLYSSIGLPHCPKCGREITRQSAEQIVARLLEMVPRDESGTEQTRIMLLAPLVRGRKGEFKKELEKLAQHGFSRARIDGELVNLEAEIPLDKRRNHTIEVVVDRLLLKSGIERRLTNSVEVAMKLGQGLVQVAVVGGGERLYSSRMACPECGINVPQLLVASHIKPWRKFPNDRLNPRNGLCLSSLHDAAFDEGLITLDEKLSVVLSKRLRRFFPQPALEQIFVPFEGKPIHLPKKLAEPDLDCVRYHREKIFQL